MKKKIAVLYPLFLGGGAELVALWMVQALQEQYDVSLITFSKENIKGWNRHFGTNLEKEQIDVRNPYPSLSFFLSDGKYSLFTIRQHMLASYYRRINQEFDLGIAAFNEMDLGKAGIQYINVPLFGHGNEIARKILKYPTSGLRIFYQRLCELATGYSDNRMKQNLTLADSKWASELVKRAYGLESQVLYPPVILCTPDILWAERENGFICSGRITPEKRIETIIEIIRLVRERGFDVHLHILGGFADPKYGNKIKIYCDVYRSWITMEGIVSRSDLALLLARHRYGIHGSISEAFGISVAEMACAGCIPFVPAGGGPAEIVDQDERLVYGDIAEAVEKIDALLSHSESGPIISSSLMSKSAKYSVDRFTEQLLNTVNKRIIDLSD